ncbi:MAG TPA: glucose-1-phosphate adenylyltransferase [Trebonia sp.]|jgi:glucose-1-phosphate adenylyltransferase|nr:glucose-1-phosphate adenylyltransferase [Trebonia sp.]
MTGKRVLGIVLAGAPGRRLTPLTAERAKAAVPFGGFYRLIDFALSNLVNGGIRQICVLTQYKSHSLDRHLATAWGPGSAHGGQVIPVPAQQWRGPRWQAGSADAIYQSLSLLDEHRPDLVVVCGADHVYRMDPAPMIDQHLARGAGVTISAIPMPRSAATDFGVMQAAADGHLIEAFLEKPARPPSRAGHPDEALVSMGIYVFDPDVLTEALHKDAADDDSSHSLGGDIIPRLAAERAAHAYDFRRNEVPGADPDAPCYWRELGTIDSYFNAHLDLCAQEPPFNLLNERWPIMTQVPCQPPAKFVHEDGDGPGRAVDSVVSNGVIVSGGLISNAVLSPGARVDARSVVNRAVILHDAHVHPDAVVENAILDKEVAVLAGAAVGVDKDHDRARGFAVSAGGITVVSKGQVVAP